MGHEIGLHYEAERYLGTEGPQNLISDLRLLEDLSGQVVVSASQHIPIDGAQISLLDYVRNEAYEPRFIEGDMTYISDSLMVWRQATPHDLLDSRTSFQFLTHPDVWIANYPNMGTALREMMEAECEVTRRRYAEVTEYYGKLLRERAERDDRFRERRNTVAKAIGTVPHQSAGTRRAG